jgi:hypothetical protein
MAHETRLEVCEQNQQRYDDFIQNHQREAFDFRDRVKTLEIRVELLQQQVLRNAIIGGIIGALIGSGAAPAVTHLIDIMLKTV